MITLFRLLREASSGTAIYPEHVLEEMLLRDNPFDIKNRSFAVGSETTYTQEWGRRRSVVSVANQTAAARGRFCLWIGPMLNWWSRRSRSRRTSLSSTSPSEKSLAVSSRSNLYCGAAAPALCCVLPLAVLVSGFCGSFGG